MAPRSSSLPSASNILLQGLIRIGGEGTEHVVIDQGGIDSGQNGASPFSQDAFDQSDMYLIIGSLLIGQQAENVPKRVSYTKIFLALNQDYRVPCGRQ